MNIEDFINFKTEQNFETLKGKFKQNFRKCD